MSESASDKCWTCYGEGVTSSEQGPEDCPDCGGLGRLPSALVRTEWRLRELERVYGPKGGETAQDMSWLIAEVRRSHQALMQILAASQDADDSDASAVKIKFIANDVLGMYPAKPV
jgi:hypothetical protein